MCLSRGNEDDEDVSWDGKVYERILLTERDVKLFLRNSTIPAMCHAWEMKCQVLFVDPQEEHVAGVYSLGSEKGDNLEALI